jgi:hypothetical protein
VVKVVVGDDERVTDWLVGCLIDWLIDLLVGWVID